MSLLSVFISLVVQSLSGQTVFIPLFSLLFIYIFLACAALWLGTVRGGRVFPHRLPLHPLPPTPEGTLRGIHSHPSQRQVHGKAVWFATFMFLQDLIRYWVGIVVYLRESATVTQKLEWLQKVDGLVLSFSYATEKRHGTFIR